MPSINVTGLGVSLANNPPIAVVRHNKDYKFIVISCTQALNYTYKRYGVTIISVKNKTVDTIEATFNTTYLNGVTNYWYMKGSKVYMYVLVGDTTNNLRYYEVEIDLSALTVTLNELWTFARATYPVYNEFLSRRFLLITEELSDNQNIISFVDTKDGSEVTTYDTGFGSYGPRGSFKVLAKPNDLQLLLGRHLAGDDFRVFNVYSKTLTTLTGTAPGSDSPQPKIITPYIASRILFPATGSSVNDSQPPIRWFDDDFSLLGSTSITSIYTNAHITGAHTIGIDSEGNLVVIAQISNNNYSIATEFRTVIMKISLTDYSLVNYITLRETSTPINPVNIGWRVYGHKWHLPLIDKDNKKLWYVEATGSQGADSEANLVEVDFSDIDIVEWNKVAYYTGVEKIPTILQLEVVPL